MSVVLGSVKINTNSSGIINLSNLNLLTGKNIITTDSGEASFNSGDLSITLVRHTDRSQKVSLASLDAVDYK